MLLALAAAAVLGAGSPNAAPPADRAPAPIRLQVVPDGNGSAAEPSLAATVALERLAPALREQRLRFGRGDAAIEVTVRGGIYRLREPLTLGPLEAGTGGLSIRAAPGETVILSGARPVGGLRPLRDEPSAGLLPEQARPSVLVADLPAAWRGAVGTLQRRGLGLPAQPLQAELFFRGRRLTLARWPDQGFAAVAATPDGERGLRFRMAGEPPPFALEREPDPWAFGHWVFEWAPWHVPLAGFDRAERTFTLKPPAPRYGIKPDRRFYLENVLGALDRPGEWYLDRANGQLFLWPPAPVRDGDLELSLTESLLHLDAASGVTVSGLVFEAARGDAVVIEGGSGNRLTGCVIRNIGNLGARVSGRDNGLDSCELHDLGDSGVLLAGGDRPTLAPGGNYLEDSTVHDFGLWTRTYTAGAVLQGVGNVVARNRVFDGPHMGVWVWGNDHVIEGNLLHDLAQDTNDTGAIYIWGDWGQRGTLIRRNTICNVRARTGFAIGIYLDLLASGISIVENKLLNVQWGMLINGGSDNLIAGNTIAGGEIPLRFEAIGMTWAREEVLEGTSDLRRPLGGLPVHGPLWARRYPGLSLAMAGDPGMPKRNVFQHNLIYHQQLGRFEPKAQPYTIMQENLLRPSSPAGPYAGLFPAACHPKGPV